MKKYLYRLSVQDQKRLFLKGYWSNPVRRIGFFAVAPALLILSVFIAVSSLIYGFPDRHLFEFLVAVFGVFLSVLFWLLPVFAIQKQKFNGRTVEFRINDEKFEVSEGAETKTFKWSSMKKVRVKGNYLYCTVQLPAAKKLIIDTALIESNRGDFIENMTTRSITGKGEKHG